MQPLSDLRQLTVHAVRRYKISEGEDPHGPATDFEMTEAEFFAEMVLRYIPADMAHEALRPYIYADGVRGVCVNLCPEDTRWHLILMARRPESRENPYIHHYVVKPKVDQNPDYRVDLRAIGYRRYALEHAVHTGETFDRHRALTIVTSFLQKEINLPPFSW